MINVQGLLQLRASSDGGVEITITATAPVDLTLTGEQWKRINELLRQEARLAAIRAETEEQRVDMEGITWTP